MEHQEDNSTPYKVKTMVVRRHIDQDTLSRLLNLKVVTAESLEQTAETGGNASSSSSSAAASSSGTVSQRSLRYSTRADTASKKSTPRSSLTHDSANDGCEYVFADGHVEAATNPDKRVLRDRQKPSTEPKTVEIPVPEVAVEKKDRGTIYSPFNTQVFPETGMWPIRAYIRFFQCIASVPSYGSPTYPFARRCYYEKLRQMMVSLRSDDRILPDNLIHPNDLEKKKSEEVTYLRPSYDNRPTHGEVRKAFRYFYNIDHLDKPLEGPHQEPGHFRDAASRIQPSAQNSATPSRSRRSNRRNQPDVAVEDKKQRKRSLH